MNPRVTASVASQDLSIRLALATTVGLDRDAVYVPSEVTGGHRPPPKLASAGSAFHLYVSKNNPGAEVLAEQLATAFHDAKGSSEGLKWTSDEAKKDNAQRFLLLLNGDTWTSKFRERLYE